MDKELLASGIYTYYPLLVGLSVGYLSKLAPLTVNSVLVPEVGYWFHTTAPTTLRRALAPGQGTTTLTAVASSTAVICCKRKVGET